MQISLNKCNKLIQMTYEAQSAVGPTFAAVVWAESQYFKIEQSGFRLG